MDQIMSNALSESTSIMGKLVVPAKIENLFDVESRERGQLSEHEVRTVTVTDALIDTGATGLLIPKRLLGQLGLRPYRTRRSRTIAGIVEHRIYTAVRLTVQGRDCLSDVIEVPDDLPVIIGQVPLELMDWVIDLKGLKLIGNPEHGGEHMMEAL
jgi:predicted aspartyl protease